MSAQFVTLVVEDNGTARLTLNRPDKFNALNRDLVTDLISTLEEVKKNQNIRVLIVTGAGSAFCAGGDIDGMISLGSLEARDWALFVKSAFDMVASLEIPVIAAINGPAIGGGCELSLACDIRIASEKARFGQPEIMLGIIPGAGGTQRLARVIGPSKAKEVIMTGRTIRPDEALRIGLIDKVVKHELLDGEVTDLAGTIAKQSLPAIRLAKELINTASDVPLEAGLQDEIKGFALTFGSKEQKEAMDNFLNRKK
ncbi:MAG: hypothetical protein HPY50_20950 [Firmicutes bacterium]|nr:hypothetical protein [Bacillota bacterium]